MPSTWQELSVLDKMTEGMGKGFLFPICFKVLTAGSAITASRPLFLQSMFNSWGYLLKQVRKLFQESSSSCQLSRWRDASDGVTLLEEQTLPL